MNNTDILHKEIDLIQNVISRMAQNSFMLKGWSVSLVTVALALTKDSTMALNLTPFNIVLPLAVLSFWYLDSFFLHKEKCYRKLYDWVIKNRTRSQDFLYSLKYQEFEKDVDSICYIMLSKTLSCFYAPMFVGLIVWIVLLLKGVTNG